jgi:hypothetical protein
MLARLHVPLAVLALPLAYGCYTGSVTQADAGKGGIDAACAQIPLPESGPVTVQGVVVDSMTDAGIPGAMVAAEYGGIYLNYCDRSHASPFYRFGGLTDATGRFTVAAREGQLGFHSFADGYLYSRALTDTAADGGTFVTIQAERVASGQPLPTVTNAGFDRTTVAPAQAVTFRATIATYDPGDPLSDENILVEPTTGFTTELDPPSPGAPDDFPDGVWTITFAAPTAAGTYTYWFSATTSHCYTSALESMTLVVR